MTMRLLLLGLPILLAAADLGRGQVPHSTPRTVRPAPVQRAPAPRPAPVRTVRPAPVRRSTPAPTRSFRPAPVRTRPAPAPRRTYSPPTPRRTYSPAPRRSSPFPRHTFTPTPTPRRTYSPPTPRRIHSTPTPRRTYSPVPRRSPPSPRHTFTPTPRTKYRTTPSRGTVGSKPFVRIVYPDRSSTRVRTTAPSTVPRTSAPPARGPRTTLRDLYRRVPRTRIDPGARRHTSPRYRERLADRYRKRLSDDLGKTRARTPGASPRPAPPRRDPAPHKGPDRAAPTPTTPDRRRGGLHGRDSGPAPRPVRPGLGSHRYRVPGRAPQPVAPKGSSPPSRRPPAGDLVAVSPIGLNHRTVRPRLRPRTGARSPRSHRSWRTGSTRRFYGSWLWRGHYLSLCFSFGYAPRWCRWGLYTYPYYYACYWPRWYYYNRYAYGFSFGFYWSSYAPWRRACWWWPRGYYLPSVWLSYYDSNVYYDEPSTVVVRDTVYVPRRTEIVHVSSSPASAADSKDSRADMVERHVSLGDFYFKEGRFAEAAESYLRALAYAPDDASLYFVLADALFATGDYHYAAFVIGKALRLDPDLARAEADKRTFYGDPDLFDEHMATLRKYLAEKPYDAAAWLVLGYNQRFSGDPEGARRSFKKVLEIDPGNEAARTLLDALAERDAGSRPVRKVVMR